MKIEFKRLSRNQIAGKRLFALKQKQKFVFKNLQKKKMIKNDKKKK